METSINISDYLGCYKNPLTSLLTYLLQVRLHRWHRRRSAPVTKTTRLWTTPTRFREPASWWRGWFSATVAVCRRTWAARCSALERGFRCRPAGPVCGQFGCLFDARWTRLRPRSASWRSVSACCTRDESTLRCSTPKDKWLSGTP